MIVSAPQFFMAAKMAFVKYAVILLGLWARICGCTQLGAQDWTLSVTRSSWDTVLEGSNVTFTCTIGSDNPNFSVWIEWRHTLFGDEIITLTAPTYVAGSHSLNLTGVSGSQAGSYRCAGSTSWSPAYWNPTTMSGWSSLPLRYRPVFINKDRTWIGANDQHNATLECFVRSDPQATVTWYGPNGANITEDTDPDRVSIEEDSYQNPYAGYIVDSLLIINPVNSSTDYGMYRCRAANGIGTYVDHDIELKETGPPEAPKNLAISNNYVTKDTIGFNWEPGYDGGEELESYYMNIREVPGDFSASNWIQRGLQERYWAYTDLQPDTLYQIAVYARNKLGTSQYSTLDVRTAPLEPGQLGISVLYIKSNGRIVVTGMPTDDDKGTCLRLAGRATGSVDDVSLRPDLDNIQHDGEFEYFGPYSDNMVSYYCRDGRCGWNSYVFKVWLSVTKNPLAPVPERGDVTMTCFLNTHNSGWIEWQYTLNQETSTNLTEPTFTESSNSLTLEGLLRDQAGWYRCAGRSYWSSGDWNPDSFSFWTAVIVYYGPEIIDKERTWIGANDNYTATLECIIQGNPLSNVTWYGPNGTIITNDAIPDRISLEDTISGDGFFEYHVISHLIISPVENITDYGMYRCRATSNTGTFDEHEILLKETGKPERPNGLHLDHVFTDSIFFQWESGYDGGEKLGRYYVNKREIPEEFDIHAWRPSMYPDMSDYFPNLKTDTVYQIAVYATNKHGSGPYATLTVRTKLTSPYFMGIEVIYVQPRGKFVITGIPEDDDAGTCLRLEGRPDESKWEWVSLRPDLACIQHDGEFLYSGPYPTDHLHCRYCRDDVCGSDSHVTVVTITTPRPPIPTGDAKNDDVVIVAVGVSVGIILLIIAIVAMCYYCKCFNCAKTSHHDEFMRNGPQTNPTVEVYTPSYDAPPSYVQAVEFDVNAGKNDDPPPAYDCVSSHTSQQAIHENEEQV